MLILQNIDIYLIFNRLQREINAQVIDSRDFFYIIFFTKKHHNTYKREKNKHILSCLFCKT